MLFLPITLNSPPVQSFRNSIAHFRVHASVTFLVNGDERVKDQFSWDAFLNVWKWLLFTGDGFAGARSVDLAMLSLAHETFLQMAP